ncbi:hypothetical protein PENTCL1PPCAC_7080, partial [Pristionchus entomophagus]
PPPPPPPPMMIPSMPTASLSTMDLSALTTQSTTSSLDHSTPHTLIPDMMTGLPSASVVREVKELNGVSGLSGVNGVPPQGVSKCQHCVYTTRYPRNMEYHAERHERLNEVDGMRSGVEREEEKMVDRTSDDAIMRMTTNAAIQMAKTNETSSFECTKCHRSFSTLSFLHKHTSIFHSQKIMNDLAAWMVHKRKNSSTKLRVMQPKKLRTALKRNTISEKDNDIHGVERHSVTSGSISPLRSDLPEGMASCDSGYSLQSLLVSTPLGLPLPSQFTARFPLSSPLLSPLTLTLTLTPLIS